MGGMERMVPHEVRDVEEFVRISERAVECRVKRSKDKVKLKLRTSRRLYTLVTTEEEVGRILRRIKCPIVEL